MKAVPLPSWISQSSGENWTGASNTVRLEQAQAGSQVKNVSVSARFWIQTVTSSELLSEC